MSFSPNRQQWLIFPILLLPILFGTFFVPNQLAVSTRDPVTAAWEAVRTAGSYHFTSDVTQVTIPVATLTNVGRTSRTEKLYLEGQNDLNAKMMELTLWSQGGSALQSDSGIGLRSENGKTFTRRAGGEWQEADDFTGAIAPEGDFLSYLAAIKDLQAQPSESRGGIDFTRYTFTIDSPRLALYLHTQMDTAMRARGELPPGAQLGVSTYFRDMVGSGELWVDHNGLPLRQILTLQFPAQDNEQVSTQIVVNFSQFGVAQTVASLASPGSGQGLSAASLSALTVNALPYALLLSLFACAMLLIYFRRAHRLQTVVVILVISAQLVGPLLSTSTSVRYFDAQTARAAAAKERRAEAKSDQQIREALGKVEFNPHANMLEKARQEAKEMGRQGDTGMAPQSPTLSISQSPALQSVDSGLDSDGDTLTNFVEARIGTSEVLSDTDSDGLRDMIEVNGFSFGGQTWYTDPTVADSNGDGLGDALEWGLTDAGLRATPQDTDSDGFPDLFDNDNDNDGVPDNKDLAPFTKATVTYSEATPLQLTLKNLAAGEPTFVEFQLRPQDEKQLWFAYNVLDWPQDGLGQVRDIDGKTYADVTSSGSQAAANDANGDMKVVPMLEIRIPTASANLPPQSDLTPFNISINNFSADGQTKVAYVPLSIVTDEKTGQRVAFSGQMRYLPNGVWNTPHEVRLAWIVQALVDLPCDASDSTQVAQGCQADGYIHNVAQPIQSYYSDWSLTGLGVREDHGATLSVIYEDPAHDDNLKDDKAIWALSFVLDHHFVLGRDDNKDNQRDLTITDLEPRFDLDNNPSDAARFDVPNILQVETQSYETLNQAVAFTAMTSTVQILNNVFKSVVDNDRSIKPLLFFAQESAARALTLDAASSNGYVTQNGGSLTLDMAPSGKPAQTTSVTAGIKWMGYCAPTTGEVTLLPCTADQYWNELEARYAATPSEPGETDPTLPSARLMMAQVYYMGLSTGFQSNVQDGARIISGIFIYDDDSTTAAKVRASLRGLASGPQIASYAFGRVFQAYANSGSMVKNWSAFMDGLHSAVTLAKDDLARLAKSQRALLVSRAAPLAIVGTILMVVTQIVSMLPDLPPTTRTVVGSISIALNIGLTIVLPIVEVGIYLYQAGLSTTIKMLTETFKITSAVRIGGLVGLAISVLVIWGFFFYGMASGNLKAGDPALNRAFFEAVAATVVAVLLTILASNPIGLIIGAILGVIDLILTLLCELGNKDLRNVPGMDGACFTLTGAVTKFLTKLLYSYDLMVNMDRGDLMVTDAPQADVANPAKGYVASNTLSITLPVTTTIMHKNPDPNNGVIIYSYMYLFSQENLKRSTFKYSLSKNGNNTPPVALDEMTGSWQHVRERNAAEGGKYLLSPMYRADMHTVPPPLTGVPLPTGINATIPFTLNMSYAIPAYECFLIVVVPICYVRSYTGDNHLSIDSLEYDIFPATLSEFLALAPKADAGLGLAWDARFPSLQDADGDGLISFTHNGLDPNDNSVDSDDDGLTDAYELERRANGLGISPILRDTDNDGLTDLLEMRLATDPTLADSDNDGLTDGTEVRHLKIEPTSGQLTTSWEGGWSVEINATVPFTIWVSSDPLNADGDNDGVSDLAERQLASDPNPAHRVDSQNRPYHPTVPNAPPLAVLLETSDADGYLAPGQSYRYTSTVIASAAVVSGVLKVQPASVLGSSPDPLVLAFDPLTFSVTQTATQSISLTVAQGIGTQQAAITSSASTRLQGSGATDWAFAPIVTEAPLGGIVAPNTPYYSAVSPSRADRQDQYFISTVALQDIGGIGFGDVLAYSIPGGSVRAIENDGDNTTAILDVLPPAMSTNSNGDTLAVWGQQRYCNQITFNSLKVVTAGADGDGSPGIEPYITLQTTNSSESPIWRWDELFGASDMTSGQQRGPNANGFPITQYYCQGPATVRVYEYDTSNNQLVDTKSIDLYAPPAGGLLTFSGSGHTIEVSVTVPLIDDLEIAAALIGSNGTVKRSFTLPPSTVPTSYKRENLAPAVASNGSGFLVAYESFTKSGIGGPYGLPQVAVQALDSNGNPLNGSYANAGSAQVGGARTNHLATAIAWVGNAYRVIWQDRRTTTVYQADVPANGQSIATPQPLTSSALSNAGTNHAPGIAYDPIRNRTLIIYPASNRQILGRVYAGDTLVAGPKVINLSQYPAARSPVVVWHPGYQGWLLSYQDDTASQRHVFMPLDENADQSFNAISGFFVAANENSLACPATQSFAVADLRFEEIPGATTFSDASGRGNNATCTAGSCPAAGYTGAPNAPLSDYALHFDGIDDGLTLNRPVQDDFSLAFWLKVLTGNAQQMLIDGGDPASSGFQLYLDAGKLTVKMPGVNASTNNRIDDDQWHFITLSRDKESGKVNGFVDGNSVIAATGSTASLNAVADLRIGRNRNGTTPLRGQIDHLQIYPSTLAQDSVTAIFNRTQQSYCVAAGTFNNSVYWARLQANQQDTRGGAISASSGLTLTIDSDLPTANFAALTNNEVVAPGLVIGGSANDGTSGVGRVEVSINNAGWVGTAGTNSWAFSLAGYSGAINLRLRAIDNVGNVGTPSAAINLTIDDVSPVLAISAPTTTIKPTKNASGRWQVSINGTVSEATSGVKTDSLRVVLEPQTSSVPLQSEQQAILNGNNWSIDYLLNQGLYDPTGVYSVTVQAQDNVGNRAAPLKTVVRLDARGPEAALNATDIARTVISQTITIGGVVSDTESVVGIDKLEIAFTPLEQLVALPAGITSEQAEALLNRPWTPVTLAQRGAGVTTTHWSFQIPAGLENNYQIDLRGTDRLGNVAISSNLWRGLIDTTDPRLFMTANHTGVSYFDAASNRRHYAIRFLCAVVDRELDQASFVCPGASLAQATRVYTSTAALQALFPDLTIVNGLAILYTTWMTTTTPVAVASACDSVGRCAQASTAAQGDSAAVEQSDSELGRNAAVSAVPLAVIVNPTSDSIVAGSNAVSVTVAAEASASLKTVGIRLDNALVQTINFTQAETVTRMLRTVGLSNVSEGDHNLAIQVTDWAGATQFGVAVNFTLDTAAPNVTIDASTLTDADTWQAQSGILRFHGTASDSVGLAAVQVRVDNGDFVDATFDGGTWQTAIYVPDPEGRTLNVTVRAIDKAGRISQVNQPIGTNLSAAAELDTTITSMPANPNSLNSASFAFTGTATAAVFECQLDDGIYQSCASPTTYIGLSKGSHTFRVHAVDGNGALDPTPASFTWTVNASALDANITSAPVSPTGSRNASFAFTATGASGFECALDGTAYTSCTSPKSYGNLPDGLHSFMVRAKNNAGSFGTPTQFTWTVVNVAPVASAQTLDVIPNVAKSIVLTATDSDSLLFAIATPPIHGTLLGIAPNLTYVPDTNYQGTDSFSFKASDGQLESNVATVTLSITVEAANNLLFLPLISSNGQ